VEAIREHLSIVSLVKAHEAYEGWAGTFHKQPQPPPLPYSNEPSQTIFYGQRQKAYEDEYQVWAKRVWDLARRAARAIYRVILFPGGWLVDSHRPSSQEGTDQEHQRQKEMLLLRRQCVPNLFFMLHTILFETKQYRDSIELADLLADDYHQLYQVFEQDELRRFLSLVRKSALKLLEQHKDPLQYF
jgi:hypothetical protein